MSDFLEQKRNEIAERMGELEPLIEEYRQLAAASSALAGIAPTQPAASARRSGARSPRNAGEGKDAVRRPGRPRGGGTRARQALALAGERPGITIPEMASAMGIKQNYLYRVLPTLEKDGKVVRRENGWHATEATSSPSG